MNKLICFTDPKVTRIPSANWKQIRDMAHGDPFEVSWRRMVDTAPQPLRDIRFRFVNMEIRGVNE